MGLRDEYGFAEALSLRLRRLMCGEGYASPRRLPNHGLRPLVLHN